MQTNEPHYAGLESSAYSGTMQNRRHAEDDDFVQAGALYRMMSKGEQKRLVDNIAASLAAVSQDEIIERSISHFRAADSSYGERVEAAVKELRS